MKGHSTICGFIIQHNIEKKSEEADCGEEEDSTLIWTMLMLF